MGHTASAIRNERWGAKQSAAAPGGTVVIDLGEQIDLHSPLAQPNPLVGQGRCGVFRPWVAWPRRGAEGQAARTGEAASGGLPVRW